MQQASELADESPGGVRLDKEVHIWEGFKPHLSHTTGSSDQSSGCLDVKIVWENQTEIVLSVVLFCLV